MKSEDIARLAGVSRSTVSRVVNNYTNVPKETYDKVMKVIKEHNYVPNNSARILAGKSNNTIGLFILVDGEHEDEGKICNNDFYTSYFNYLVDYANALGYYVLISTITSREDHRRIRQVFDEKRIDGGIVLGTRMDTFNDLDLSNIDYPLVAVDYYEDHDINNLTVVNSDDKCGIEKAYVYLRDLGHKDIGFVKGNEITRSGRERLRGYLETARSYGQVAPETMVMEGDFDSGMAYRSMKSEIRSDRLLSAYICANDYMAIGVIKALKEEGYEVPGDVSVIGFDNIMLSEQSSPRVTTLMPDFRAISQKVIELLDLKLNKKDVKDILEFEVKLIPRESCCSLDSY